MKKTKDCPTCKTCKNFDRSCPSIPSYQNYGYCEDLYDYIDINNAGNLRKHDSIIVYPDFGCIGHEEKEIEDE